MWESTVSCYASPGRSCGACVTSFVEEPPDKNQEENTAQGGADSYSCLLPCGQAADRWLFGGTRALLFS